MAQWSQGFSDMQAPKPRKARRVKLAQAVNRIVGILGRGEHHRYTAVTPALLGGDEHRRNEQGAVRCAGIVARSAPQWKAPNNCLPSPLT